MKKGLTELVFILDRSGSMRGLERDTIGGFNSMIDRHRNHEGEANVTTVLFDDQYDVVHDHCPVQTVQPLTNTIYYARGGTALLDAIGKTICMTEAVQTRLPEAERAEKIIFVITTDGMENCSREYSYRDVQEMITAQKQKFGWEFLFLGANMDAVSEAKRFGIGASRAVTFRNDSAGVQLNYQVLSDALSDMRSRDGMSMCSAIGAEWKKRIEEDFENRKENVLGK